MDYKKAAIDDLRHHAQRKEALKNIKERIAALGSQYEASKTNTFGAEPVQGGASQVEDRWIGNIMARERLKVSYAATRRLVDIVERGLESLDERQWDILLKAYDPVHKQHWAATASALNISKSEYYRELDAALRDFTIAMYGITDL